jgi:hypothetical protein
MTFTIEVYSPEGNRWYLWLDGVTAERLDAELTRATRLYGTFRVFGA